MAPGRREAPAVAAVDLGSNSFHMVVAHDYGDHIQFVDKIKERVQLAAGLDRKKRLTVEARDRALLCLERFGQRVRDLPEGSVRAVGTNTLRVAKNRRTFLEKAHEALGHPIEVISGQEEARLIYLGVAKSVAARGGSRLVVDIGGGSTEVMLGEGLEVDIADSLHMGCVSFSMRFFEGGKIDEKRMHEAEISAALELRSLRYEYRDRGWDLALGSSGTIGAIDAICREAGFDTRGITPRAMDALRKAMLDAGRVDRLSLPGLSGDRAPVLPGGFAILAAVFDSLKVEHMQPARGALREGLLYDLLGRIHHEDVRHQSVRTLAERTQIDRQQAERVKATALDLFAQVKDEWGLDEDDAEDLLAWAAQLHELGLSFAHSGYHKHGAYLVQHADLPGFSKQDQAILSALVRTHRRKMDTDLFDAVPSDRRKQISRLSAILRLAVKLNRNRSRKGAPKVELRAKKSRLELRFQKGFLDGHPLTRADMEDEAERLAGVGLKLSAC